MSRLIGPRLGPSTCEKHGIEPGELIIHSDRGAPMTSKTLAQLLADLGVEKSFSRPHVSNDNPFSESAFKTLKYSPGFPDRFGGGFDHALAHCRHFFPWYNVEHHHGGLVGLTPAQVHFGRATAVPAEREQVLRACELPTTAIPSVSCVDCLASLRSRPRCGSTHQLLSPPRSSSRTNTH